jgi:hypothetical protein
MRLIIALASLLLGAAIVFSSAYGAKADTVSTAAGAGASVTVVSGSDGGTTILVDSQHPCRTETARDTASLNPGSHSGSNSTTVTTGAGGLSGSSTAGGGGTTVTINPGSGGTVTRTSSASSVAAAGECVIVIRAPAN